MTVTFVLFLLCTLFLVWCNYSIETARLFPPRRWVSSVKKLIFLPKFVIFWRADIICEFIRGYLKFVTQRYEEGRKWLLQAVTKGEEGYKKHQIARYVTVGRSLRNISFSENFAYVLNG